MILKEPLIYIYVYNMDTLVSQRLRHHPLKAAGGQASRELSPGAAAGAPGFSFLVQPPF